MEISEVEVGMLVTVTETGKAARVHAVNSDQSILLSMNDEVLARHYHPDQLEKVEGPTLGSIEHPSTGPVPDPDAPRPDNPIAETPTPRSSRR